MSERQYEMTIITPFHNIDHKYFENCYKSVKEQSFGFENIEWVVVVHNSNEDLEFIKNLISHHDNVKIEVLEDSYHCASSPRNRGLDLATGKYVGFLDADDAYDTKCVETALQALKKNNAQLVRFRIEEVRADPGISLFGFDSRFNSAYEEYVYHKDDKDLDLMFEYELWGLCTTYIYDKSYLDENNFRFNLDITFCEDFELILRVLMNCDCVCYLTQYIGYKYYVHYGSAIRVVNATNDQIISYAQSLDILFTRLSEYGISSTMARLLNFSLFMQYIYESETVDVETLDQVKNILGKHRKDFVLKNVAGMGLENIISQFMLSMTFFDYDAKTILEFKNSDAFGQNIEIEQNIYNTLHNILGTNASCDYLKRYHSENIFTIKDYQKAVPITEYKDYKKYLDLMIRTGKKDCLISGEPYGYAYEKSQGETLCFPVAHDNIREMIELLDTEAPYCQNLLSLNFQPMKYETNARNVPVGSMMGFAIRQYCYNDALPYSQSELIRDRYTDKFALPEYLNTGGKLEHILFFALMERGVDCIYVLDFNKTLDFFHNIFERKDELLQAVYDGDKECKFHDPKAVMCKGNADRAKELYGITRLKSKKSLAKKLWPNLGLVRFIGTPENLNNIDKEFYEIFEGVTIKTTVSTVYSGLLGEPIYLNDNNYIMNLDNLFLEFIDCKQKGESTPVTVLSLKKGHRYKVLITSKNGLYRCQIPLAIKILDLDHGYPIYSIEEE
ncbi:MAG: GH3 auxin-responsive promoter family protein [Enterococcus sp.]|nr:GH3 auxin-responsive promoter family protein [Enterococcus sp.]